MDNNKYIDELNAKIEYLKQKKRKSSSPERSVFIKGKNR